MDNKGFTLLELMLVLVLLSIIIIAALVTLDPFEQIKKSKDTSMFNTSDEVHNAVIRFYAIKGRIPYDADIEGMPLESNEGQEIINKLINTGELKKDFSNLAGSNTMSEMFFTGKVNNSYFTVCFIPKSKSYIKSNLAIYDKYGNITDCSSNICYICSGRGPLVAISPTIQILSPTPLVPMISPTPSYCENFNPEKPDYPFTCNNSTKWIIYGCTNYCVQDLGCDSYCSAGLRHLRKNYYATKYPGLLTCLNHASETVDNYCVSGEAANCDNIPYPSSDTDFLWGCSDPRRPYIWK